MLTCLFRNKQGHLHVVYLHMCVPARLALLLLLLRGAAH
jgi:hypothetical protein